MGELRRFEKIRRPEEIGAELNKIGFEASPIQKEGSDFIKYMHRETSEVVLVDFALGRFIYGDGEGLLASESSTGYENNPRYNQILDALFCNEIFNQTTEDLNGRNKAE